MGQQCCSCSNFNQQIEIFYQGEPQNLKYTIMVDQTLEQLLLKLQQDDNFIENIDIQKSQFLGGKIVKKFKDQRPIKLIETISDLTYINIKPPEDLEPQELIVNGVQLIQTQKMKFFNLKNNINRLLEIPCDKDFNIYSFWDQLTRLGLISDQDADLRFFEGVQYGVSVKIIDKQEDISDYQEILIRYKKKTSKQMGIKLRKKSFSRILKSIQSENSLDSIVKTMDDSDLQRPAANNNQLQLDINNLTKSLIGSKEQNYEQDDEVVLTKENIENFIKSNSSYKSKKSKKNNEDNQHFKEIKYIDDEECCEEDSQEENDEISQKSQNKNTVNNQDSPIKTKSKKNQQIDIIHEEMSTIKENSIESNMTSKNQQPNTFLQKNNSFKNKNSLMNVNINSPPLNSIKTQKQSSVNSNFKNKQ